jgi:tetratricopeptide (TPR) repeat protein
MHKAENTRTQPLTPTPETQADVSRRLVSPLWQRAWRRAERQIEQGAFLQAVAAFRQARKQGADPYLCLLRIADLYRQMQQWNQAFGALEQAVALEPTRLSGWELLLEFAQEAGDRDRAVFASHALIKLVPRHIPAHNMLGAAYMQQGDVEAALRVANTLIRLEPDVPAHHFKKALLCQHQNEVALAVQEFMQTLRLGPEGPLAESAREALETLDLFQLNQIVTLAIEDAIFRAHLLRQPVNAVEERGFALSPMGEHLLTDFCQEALPDCPASQRPTRYH